MRRWKVHPNMLPVDYTVEAGSYDQAIEEAKDLWRRDADDLEWSAEEITSENETESKDAEV